VRIAAAKDLERILPVRDIWSETAIIELPVYVLVCDCGNDSWIHVRSTPTGDGATLERKICTRCRARVRVDRKRLPISGNDELDID
jgi:hypothetical protein